MRTKRGSHFAFACGALLAFGASGCASTGECDSYVPTSIASLRRATGSGCFELSRVVLIARTPSTSAPRLYLQDTRGGPYSALMAKCASGGSHPCPAETADRMQTLLDGSALTVRGYYHQGSTSGFEQLYLDSVEDEGYFVPAPAPLELEPKDVSQSAHRPADWFQSVSVSIPAGDPWVMADLSPAEFALGPECPRWGGFAMIPASAQVPRPEDCANGVNPNSAPADPARVLIGRQFYNAFWASTDCSCAFEHHQHLLSPFSTVVGRVSGILIFQKKRELSFQVLEPFSKQAFPVSGG